MFPIAIQDRSLCMIFSGMVLTMNIFEVTVPKLENITSHTEALLTAPKRIVHYDCIIHFIIVISFIHH